MVPERGRIIPTSAAVAAVSSRSSPVILGGGPARTERAFEERSVGQDYRYNRGQGSESVRRTVREERLARQADLAREQRARFDAARAGQEDLLRRRAQLNGGGMASADTSEGNVSWK